MSKKTNILVDELYEELAATYQCLEIQRLNEVLLRHGVVDRSQRMTICGEFAASVGALRDQFWFEAGGVKVHPAVAFTTSFTNDSPDPAALGTVYWRNPEFSFTEYAYGDTHHFFEEQGESLDDVPSGTVDEE